VRNPGFPVVLLLGLIALLQTLTFALDAASPLPEDATAGDRARHAAREANRRWHRWPAAALAVLLAVLLELLFFLERERPRTLPPNPTYRQVRQSLFEDMGRLDNVVPLFACATLLFGILAGVTWVRHGFRNAAPDLTTTSFGVVATAYLFFLWMGTGLAIT
jgi:hypothetical protein